jgi:hypothetical protein
MTSERNVDLPNCQRSLKPETSPNLGLQFDWCNKNKVEHDGADAIIGSQTLSGSRPNGYALRMRNEHAELFGSLLANSK